MLVVTVVILSCWGNSKSELPFTLSSPPLPPLPQGLLVGLTISGLGEVQAPGPKSGRQLEPLHNTKEQVIRLREAAGGQGGEKAENLEPSLTDGVNPGFQARSHTRGASPPTPLALR